MSTSSIRTRPCHAWACKGSGQIRPGLEAGYRLEFAVPGNPELSFTDVNDLDDGTGGIRTRHASWYLKHDQLGTLTVGQTDGAATGMESIDLSGAASWISYNGAQDWNFSYHIFDSDDLANTSGFIWASVLDDFDVGRGSFIRYNSPTFAGFDFSASWGEDDRYDLALRYSNDWNGLSVAAGVGYSNSSDEPCSGGAAGDANGDGVIVPTRCSGRRRLRLTRLARAARPRSSWPRCLSTTPPRACSAS